MRERSDKFYKDKNHYKNNLWYCKFFFDDKFQTSRSSSSGSNKIYLKSIYKIKESENQNILSKIFKISLIIVIITKTRQ